MRILFRCGHVGKFREGQTPVCRECGATGITRVFAPPPHFVGTASGPLCDTKDMDPATACFVETRLRLKEPDHGA